MHFTSCKSQDYVVDGVLDRYIQFMHTAYPVRKIVTCWFQANLRKNYDPSQTGSDRFVWRCRNRTLLANMCHPLRDIVIHSPLIVPSGKRLQFAMEKSTIL